MERQFNLSVNLFIHSFSLHARRCGGRAGGLHPSKYTTDRPRPSDCVKDCTHPPSAGVGCLSANLVEATRISAVAGIPDVHSRYALLNACPSRLSRRCACPVGFGSDRMSTLTEASHATPEPKKKPWHAYRLAYMQTHRRGKLTIERWAQRGTHSRLHSYHTHKETNTHTHTHTHTPRTSDRDALKIPLIFGAPPDHQAKPRRLLIPILARTRFLAAVTFRRLGKLDDRHLCLRFGYICCRGLSLLRACGDVLLNRGCLFPLAAPASAVVTRVLLFQLVQKDRVSRCLALQLRRSTPKSSCALARVARMNAAQSAEWPLAESACRGQGGSLSPARARASWRLRLAPAPAPASFSACALAARATRVVSAQLPCH